MALLNGKSALITGAASGIGAAIAKRFAQSGCSQLVLVDLNDEILAQKARELKRDTGIECVTCRADVSNEQDVANVFAQIRDTGLDILVNSAGVCRIVDIEDLQMKAWDLTMNVNLKGPFLFAREALRLMKPKKYGRIINIASQAGKIGGLIVGMDYSSSKAGLLCLTKSLAKNCAEYGVTVNSVAPGLINTEMTTTFGYDPETIPLKRVGTPEEVADVALFLASDLSRYVTGACIDVNGGMTMW